LHGLVSAGAADENGEGDFAGGTAFVAFGGFSQRLRLLKLLHHMNILNRRMGNDLGVLLVLFGLVPT
jgi:succinate-acetate transporter protein